ncbi:MAG: alr0857 family protein [Cyanobacteria bacterium P01_H01_bin.15]
MLRFIYTQAGVQLNYLEHQSLEQWMAEQVRFKVRIGESFQSECIWASFPLPRSSRYLWEFRQLSTSALGRSILFGQCDRQAVEVSLRGIWLESCHRTSEGTFLAELPQTVEHLWLQIWQEAQQKKFTLV